MGSDDDSTLRRLLATTVSKRTAESLLRTVTIPDDLLAGRARVASRAIVAQALSALLFSDLVSRAPTLRRYVDESIVRGRKIRLDHLAVATLALDGMGSLPRGQEAIGRVLMALGYEIAERTALESIGMRNFVYRSQDLPDVLPQFVVSELHPRHFSTRFQVIVRRVTSNSRAPLDHDRIASMQTLTARRQLPLETARLLLPALVFCFGRHHNTPRLQDYELLGIESPEAARIAADGNAVHHIADRVDDLGAVVLDQRRRSRPLRQLDLSLNGLNEVRLTSSGKRSEAATWTRGAS